MKFSESCKYLPDFLEMPSKLFGKLIGIAWDIDNTPRPEEPQQLRTQVSNRISAIARQHCRTWMIFFLLLFRSALLHRTSTIQIRRGICWSMIIVSPGPRPTNNEVMSAPLLANARSGHNRSSTFVQFLICILKSVLKRFWNDFLINIWLTKEL